MTAALDLYLKKELGGNKKNGKIKGIILSKEERLSWKRYIDLLFEKDNRLWRFHCGLFILPLEEEMSAPVSIPDQRPQKRNSNVP